MQVHRSRRSRTHLAVLALLLLVSACSNGGDGGEATGKSANSGDPLDLRGACPSKIVVQTSWDPNVAAFGALYHLLGPNPDIDAGKKSVTAPLVARGKDTGVKLELRAGGPAIGFTQATAQMYLDTSITLGVSGAFDEVLQLSARQPTIAVAALQEIDPQIILWDPATYPQFNTIRDIGRTDTKVLYFGGDTYMEYLVGTGILKRSQVDGSYDGSPSRFVVERGKVAQSGYATDDPYVLEKDVKEWGKPVKYQLVYETDYPNYGPPLVVRAGDKGKLAPCLRRLVPIVQQAQVDVIAEPDRTIDLTLRLNKDYKSGTPYTRAGSDFTVSQLKNLKLSSNGNDGTAGNFDESRVQRMIDITKPIFAAQKKPVKEGLKPSDVVTNEFINPKIGFTAK